MAMRDPATYTETTMRTLLSLAAALLLVHGSALAGGDIAAGKAK